MKRILLIAVLLGTMITATTYFVCIAAPSVLFGKGIKGSGNIVTRTIDAPDFDRVDAARAVKVVITGKATGKITIEADDNIMEYVVVEAKGGRLTATIDKSRLPWCWTIPLPPTAPITGWPWPPVLPPT